MLGIIEGDSPPDRSMSMTRVLAGWDESRESMLMRLPKHCIPIISSKRQMHFNLHF